MMAMKRYTLLYILFAVMAAVMLPSCSENDDTVEEYPDWQATNEAFWNSLYSSAATSIANGDDDWKIVRKWSLEDSLTVDNTNFVVAHVESRGEGTECPLYTDSVSVYYEGSLLPSASYPTGRVFDSQMPPASRPVTFYAGGLVDGFTTALMNMHEGDVWTVYMPCQMGYGTTGNSSIPGYSMLTFKIHLVEIK